MFLSGALSSGPWKCLTPGALPLPLANASCSAFDDPGGMIGNLARACVRALGAVGLVESAGIAVKGRFP